MTVAQALSRLQQAHPHLQSVGFVGELEKASLIFDSHADFLAHYKRIDCDFVFDKASGLYFVSTNGQHADLMSELYWYHQGARATQDKFEAADRFVLDGLGLFKSRAGRRIFRGVSFETPVELRFLHRDLEILEA